jgi:hypothetical protein
MTPFEFVTGTMLLIVGLGVAQLLNGLVDRIRRRRENNLHWIPLVWALLVFLFQMQFLWSSFALSSLIESWTGTAFLFLLGYAILLFLAGVLVLPRADIAKSHGAFDSFLRDGRWALIALALYMSWAFVINPIMFEAKFLSPDNLLQLLGVIILVTTFFGRSKLHWTAGTLLFTAYSIIMTVIQSCGYYE